MLARLKSYLKDSSALVAAAVLVAVAFVFAKMRLLRMLFRTDDPPPATPTPTFGVPEASAGTQEAVRSVETESAAERAEAGAKAEGAVETLGDVASVKEGAARRSLLARLLRKS